MRVRAGDFSAQHRVGFFPGGEAARLDQQNAQATVVAAKSRRQSGRTGANNANVKIRFKEIKLVNRHTNISKGSKGYISNFPEGGVNTG